MVHGSDNYDPTDERHRIRLMLISIACRALRLEAALYVDGDDSWPLPPGIPRHPPTVPSEERLLAMLAELDGVMIDPDLDQADEYEFPGYEWDWPDEEGGCGAAEGGAP